MSYIHLPSKYPDGGMKSMKQQSNFKSILSIVLFALVDAIYWFSWASVSVPGNTHGSRYFQLADLRRLVSKGNAISEETCIVTNLNIPWMVLFR